MLPLVKGQARTKEYKPIKKISYNVYKKAKTPMLKHNSTETRGTSENNNNNNNNKNKFIYILLAVYRGKNKNIIYLLNLKHLFDDTKFILIFH